MQTPLKGIKPLAKKICWLENAEIFGGAEMFGLEMMEQIAKNFSQEIDIHYLHNGNHPEILKKISDLQNKLPEYIHLRGENFFLPKLSKCSVSTLQNLYTAVRGLQTKIAKENYDVIYSNTVRTGIITVLVSVFSFMSKKRKIIFFAHDYTFPKKILQFFLSKCTKIYACSYPVKNFLMQHNIPAADIIVIENGVDITKLSKIAAKKLSTDAIRIGIIGRITQWKGQLTVVKAARRISDLYPKKNIQFFFYGEPSQKPEDQEFFLRLQHFVTENNLQKKIFFKGFTPLARALKNSDMIIHAAQEPEPFGRTPLEAAASGRPLIVSHMGTPAQIFTDEHNALFFEPQDKKDLAEKIIQVIDDPQLAEKISTNAKTLVAEKFSLDMIGKRFWKNFFEQR